MQILAIKLSAIDAKPEYALLNKKDSNVSFIDSDWETVKSNSRGRKIVLLIPNTAISLHTLALPKNTSKKQLKQAIPFALEENLADDIDDLHFAYHQKNEETHVAVATRTNIDAYTALLKSNKLTAHYILPELMALPYADDTWAIQANKQTVLARFDAFSGLQIARVLANEILSDNLKSHPASTLITNLNKDDLTEDLQALSHQQDETLNTASYEGITAALPLNLTSGYVRDRKTSSVNWSIWKPSLVLASILGLFFLGTLTWKNQQLSKLNKQYSSAIGQVFQDTFPGKRIQDAPRQMAGEFARLNKDKPSPQASPLKTIATITPFIKQDSNIKLRDVNYNNNKLILNISTNNISSLNSFKDNIQDKSNIEVNIKSSSTLANTVNATLVLNEVSK